MTTRRVFWSVGPLAALAAVILACSQSPQARAQVVKQGSQGAETRHGLVNRTDEAEKRCKASDLIGMDVRGLKGDEKIGLQFDGKLVNQEGFGSNAISLMKRDSGK